MVSLAQPQLGQLLAAVEVLFTNLTLLLDFLTSHVPEFLPLIISLAVPIFCIPIGILLQLPMEDNIPSFGRIGIQFFAFLHHLSQYIPIYLVLLLRLQVLIEIYDALYAY